MSMIGYLIVGGMIGWIAGFTQNREVPGGIVGNMMTGIIGSTIGGYLLPTMGPTIFGMQVFPATLGAIILVSVISFVLKQDP